MALLASLVIVIASHAGASARFQGAIFNYLVQLNPDLDVLQPAAHSPLDGGAVLAWVLPRSWQGVVDSCNATVPLSCCSSY